MNDKTKSKVDTKIEAEELKGEALEDKDLDQVTGGYISFTYDKLKSDGNGKTGVSRRKVSSGWEEGDWNG